MAGGRIAGIYKVTSPTGRIYIGQSINIFGRFQRYRDLNCRSQRKLYRSLVKYGWESHRFEIAHELPTDINKEVLDSYERLYIKTYTASRFKMLNIKGGGSNGPSSKETRIRQSIALKGRVIKNLPMSAIKDEFIAGTPIGDLTVKYNIGHNALSKRLKTEIGTTEVEGINFKRKMESLNSVAKKFTPGFTPWNKGTSVGAGADNNFFGKTHSSESKSLMSTRKEKPIICINTSTEYKSAKEAAAVLNLNESSVAKAARGFQKQHKGFVFKYI